MISRCGSRYFQILPTHLHVTPVPCALIQCKSSSWLFRKGMVGFGRSVMSWSWSCGTVRETCIFTTFSNFLPVIAPLRIVCMMFSFQQLQVCSLIFSLPILEDLQIWSSKASDLEGYTRTVLRPSNPPPPLTGTLKIHEPRGGIEHFIRGLSEQLNGIRFRKLECTWGSRINPMSGWSNTLEYVDVCYQIRGMLHFFPAV